MSMGIFQKVRKTLDENGYREVLPLEAVPLVQHLLGDLISCKEELRAKSTNLQDLKQKKDCLELSLVPYQEENGRLLSQVNQLHMENLQLREGREKVQKEKENALHRLRNEKTDLQFLVEELKREKSSLEELAQKKGDKIILLQERSLKAVVTTPGGTKHQRASERQHMEISSLVPPSAKMNSHQRCATCGCGNSGSVPEAKNKDLYLADLLRMTDKKLLLLQKEVEAQKENVFHGQQRCAELAQKVQNRDCEISRLQSLLEGGRAVAAVMEDNKLMAAHSQLHQLKLQVDHLTKTNSQLELKLKAVLGDTHEAMSRALQMVDVNKDLESELQHAATANLRLEEDRNSTAETLTQQLVRNKDKLKLCKGDLLEHHSLYHSTLAERDGLKSQLDQLRVTHSRASQQMAQLVERNSWLKSEKESLEEVLLKGQGERKSLADRINRLTVQLQDCDMDRRRLSSEATTLRSSIANLERNKKEGEASLEVLKEEVKKLSQQKGELELEKSFVRSELIKLQGVKDQLDHVNSFLKAQVKQVEEEKAAVEQARDYFSDDITNLKMQVSELKKTGQKTKDKLEETSEALESCEREKGHYSEQVLHLLDILKVKPASMAAAQLAKSKLDPEEELGKALYEREVLRQERNFFKAQLQGRTKGQMSKGDRHRTGGQSQEQVQEDARGGSSTEEGGQGSFPPGTEGVDGAVETVDTLRAEREHLLGQVQHFQHLYNEAKIKVLSARVPAAVPSPRSPVLVSPPRDTKDGVETSGLRHELSASERERDFFKDQFEKLKKSLAVKSDQAALMDTDDVENLLRERKVLSDERNFYLKQYKEMSARIKGFSPSPRVPQSGRLELEAVLAEKRSIALAKAQLEAQVMNLKDDLNALELENTEVASSRKELSKTVENLQNAAMQKFPPSMQNFIGEIRKSRDAALAEAEKLRQEMDRLKAKMKSSSAQQIRDKTTAQEDVSALQMQKKECEAFNAELQDRLQSQATLIASLQDQIQTLQDTLQQAQSELGLSSKQSDQFKKMLHEKVGQADSQGQQLVTTASQLSACSEKVAQLEAEVVRLELEVAKWEGENFELKRNLGRLDSDKDNLNNELDTKSEFISSLKSELKKRSAQIVALEAEATKREATIQSCEMAIEMEQRKVSEEAKRSERLQQDLLVTSEQRDAANREIRRLQKEVAGLSQDVRELQAELERTKACRENFKRKAQEYCRTLENLSISITTKDKEQDNLMQEYLSLNETISSLKMLNASLEETSANQNEELHKMENMLQTFQKEREELIAQVNEALTKTEELESSCQRLKEEKFLLEKDLLTSKDLTQKVEMKRNELDCEGRRLSASLEKLLEEKRLLEHQLESFSSQLQSERTTLRSLEEMLADKRKAEFVAETNIQQLQVEKTQLMRKVEEFRCDFESEAAEVKRLRSRSASLEVESERLKRQLTTEQYERERTLQELRRVRKYSSLEGALGGGNGARRPSPPSPSPSPSLFPPQRVRGAEGSGCDVTGRGDSGNGGSSLLPPPSSVRESPLRKKTEEELPPTSSSSSSSSSPPFDHSALHLKRLRTTTSFSSSFSSPPNSNPALFPSSPHKTFYSSFSPLPPADH